MVTNANNNLHKIQIQISIHGFNDTLISQEINAKKELEEILDNLFGTKSPKLNGTLRVIETLLSIIDWQRSRTLEI